VVVIALVASVLGCVAPSDSAVVGFWEPESTSRGGIGQTIELKASGELLSSTTAMVDQVYRTADGKLFIAGSGAPFKVTKNVLVQTDEKGDEIRKERVGGQAAGKDPLVGAWRYRHYTGAVAFERYTEDGRLLFRLPMTSQQGCYRATGGALNLDVDGRTNTAQYTVAGTRLTLRSADGKTYAYRRAEPWYPREQIDYQPPPK
jgi:hypothetical protein